MVNLNIKKKHYEVLKELTDKQVGEFVKGACAYAYDNKPFTTKDKYLEGLFIYVKHALVVAKQNSINGRKGAVKHKDKPVGVILKSVVVSNVREGGKRVE